MKPAFGEEYRFAWKDLGDIDQGRPNLGDHLPVAVYRLTQYTMREAIARRFGEETAEEILREAGWIAGREFCLNMLDISLDFPGFMAQLQRVLKAQMMGVMRVEEADEHGGEVTLALSEDLDCSGLPIKGNTVCAFDEGFFAGIFRTYTGREYSAREVDCWSTGHRTCRFEVRPEPTDP
jgi:hypothetical protein